MVSNTKLAEDALHDGSDPRAAHDLPARVRRRRVAPPGGRAVALKTADFLGLRMMVWAPAEARGTVAIVPGRTEYIERYSELVADLLDRRLAVAIFDMRNHGLSPRPLRNRHKHHLTDFALMVDDVTRFVAKARESGLPEPFFLLGHSMGAHVVLRYLHRAPIEIAAAILSAPMIRIRFGGMPIAVIRLIVATALTLGLSERYAFGQGDWQGGLPRERLRDYLTSDRDRFADEDWQLARNPALRLGGVTFGWLDAALASCDRLATSGYAESITVKTLFLLGGADRVIDNASARAFARRMPQARVVEIAGARHEIFRERDRYRDQALSALDAFIDAAKR